MAIGEGTIYAFEQVYLGKKTVNDIEWIKNLIESKMSSQFINNVKSILERTTEKQIIKLFLILLWMYLKIILYN